MPTGPSWDAIDNLESADPLFDATWMKPRAKAKGPSKQAIENRYATISPKSQT